MKKLTITVSIVIILGLLVVFGMPYVMGIIIQKQYPNIMQKFSSPSKVAIKVLSYKRGWFSSAAQLQITFQTPWATRNTTNNDFSFIINEQIKHGPVILAKINGATKLIFARALLQHETTNPTLSFRTSTIWTFGNKLNGTFYSGNMVLSDNLQKITLSGLQGQVQYDPRKKVKIFFKLGSAQITTKILNTTPKTTTQNLIELKKVASVSNFNKQGLLWYGKRNINIDRISITTSKNKTIVLTGLAFSTNQTQEKDKTNVSFNYSTKHLSGNGLNVGPIQITLFIKNLDTDALTALINKTMFLEKQSVNNSLKIATLYHPILNLISKGLTIHLKKFFINTQQGPVDIDAQMILPQQSDHRNIQYLIRNTQASANLQLPHRWLTEKLTNFYKKKPIQKQNIKVNITPKTLADQQIKHWINNNWLVQSGNMLTLKLTFNNGKLMINDKLFQRSKLQILPSQKIQQKYNVIEK